MTQRTLVTAREVARMSRPARMLSWHGLAGCVVGVLAPLPVPVHAAQPLPSADLGEIHCSATAMVPIVRIKGTRELVGDIVITCHNAGPADRPEPRGFVDVEVVLSLNVGVGNPAHVRLGSDVVDAVLVVNEKNCAATSATRSFDGCGPGMQTVQDPMLARIDAAESGTLRWSGVAFPIPGAAIRGPGAGIRRVDDCTARFGVPDGCHPLATTIRLTNIRVNASQLGASGRTTGTSVPVQALLSVRAMGTRIRLNGSSLRVAEASTGFSVQAVESDFGRLCSHGEAVAEVALSEGFASSFKAVGNASFRPGQPGWEEAFYPGSPDHARPSYLAAATRIRIGLSGIPAGISVAAPATATCLSDGSEATELALVENPSSSGLGGTIVPPQAGDRPLRVSEDFELHAVYEVRRTDPLHRESCSVPFRFSRSTSAVGVFGGATVTASASLAPFESAEPDGSRDDMSRFAKVRMSAGGPLRLARCGTTLFFPFVSNRSNFDTAIIISNTSADPLGTRHQSGQCLLRYHGSGVAGQEVPSIQRPAAIKAGQHLAFTLSNGRPDRGLVSLTDFQGFLVAECAFQHGHGFAFVTEQVNGIPILAQGYLAEVVEGAPEALVAEDAP